MFIDNCDLLLSVQFHVHFAQSIKAVCNGLLLGATTSNRQTAIAVYDIPEIRQYTHSFLVAIDSKVKTEVIRNYIPFTREIA